MFVESIDRFGVQELVPVLQITDAAVKGSEEEGGEREAKVAAVGVQLCSRCSSLARQGYADTALKTEARKLWRLGGGEADFPRQGLITQVMSPSKLVSVTAVHRHVVVDIHAFVVNRLQEITTNNKTTNNEQTTNNKQQTTATTATAATAATSSKQQQTTNNKQQTTNNKQQQQQPTNNEQRTTNNQQLSHKDRMGGDRQPATREAQRVRDVGREGIQDTRKARVTRVDTAIGGAESRLV